MPEVGYTRPAQVDSTGLVVSHVTEDGLTRQVFDFSDLDCPADFLLSLVQGFACATGQGGRWKAAASARAGASTLRRFVRALESQGSIPSRIEDLGPEVWWTWRAGIESTNRWPGMVNQLRALLADTPGVPELTRKAMRGRARKPKNRQYVAYTRDEFHQIRAVASNIARTGQRRIDANLRVLDLYRSGHESADALTVRVRGKLWTAGGLLDHLSQAGSVPPGTSVTGSSTACRALLNLDGATTINEALFPNSGELLSIAFLLTCTSGYNPAVINRLTVDTDRADDQVDEDPIHVVHLDKPRRGPGARFSDESLMGNSTRVLERAKALTSQARRTLALLGAPTDSLILFRAANGGDGPKVFRTALAQPHTVYPRWHAMAELTCDDGTPLWVTFQRLRLTEQVLNTKPRQNSPSVSEEIYRRPDPQTQRAARATIVQGQASALEHAQATMVMRTLSASEIAAAQQNPTALAGRLGVAPEKVRLLTSGALNTATGACLDFTASPFSTEKGQPCPASFLACLGCSNAVATPAHLPRLVALSEALDRIGSAVSRGVWEEDYADAHLRLTELLETNTTAEQRVHARAQVTSGDEAMIERLLTRGLDT